MDMILGETAYSTILLCVPTVAFTLVLASYAILLSPTISFTPMTNQIPSLIWWLPQSAYGQSVEQGSRCNCVIDDTSSGNSNNNITGITIPSVKLLKNETLQSQTEGHLSWIAIKSTQLMGIVVKDFYLGNFSSGTAATVALNTIDVRPNESLGIKISGGTIPAAAAIEGEFVKADVNVNGTLGEIKTVGSNTIQFPLHYNKVIKKPVLGINRFLVSLNGPGYYLLLISLSYNTKSVNSFNNNTGVNHIIGIEQTRYPLVALYETVLKVS
jgi:hypothetical protein